MGSPVGDKRTVQKGSSFAPATIAKGTWQQCTVMEVHPNTYTCEVLAQDNRRLTLPWPKLEVNPAATGGEVSVPRRGQVFELHSELGTEYLGNPIPMPVLGPKPPAEHRVMYDGEQVGGIDPVYSNVAGRPDFRGGMPADVLPGDWVRVGSTGNLLGVLEGGVVLLKASELAKVLASPTGDLLQLIGRNLDVLSDFGEIHFRNEDGRVSMTLKGGSQQQTDSSPAEEKYTLHVDLGHAGDIANFRITDQAGAVVGQVHYKPDGSVETRNSGEVHEVNGKSDKIIHGDATETVEGAETRWITGSSSEVVGEKVVTSTGDVSAVAGNDVSVGAGRDVTLTAGRRVAVSAPGSKTAKPGDAAMSTVVTNGSWVIDIGDPAAGDLQSALSGFEMKSMNDVSVQSRKGKIALKTTAPQGVQLGGVAPVWKAVRGEILEEILELLVQNAEAHIHQAQGPVSPTSVGMKDGIPVAGGPDIVRLKLLMKKLKSDLVTLGG